MGWNWHQYNEIIPLILEGKWLEIWNIVNELEKGVQKDDLDD